MAETGFDPYAAYTLDHTSNLFALPEQGAAGTGGTPPVGDTVSTFLAGFDSNFTYGRQRFRATIEGRRLVYDQFTYLDHDEYLADLGLDWKLGRIFDGKIDALSDRRIVTFADRTTTQLTINTDKDLKGTFNVAVTPVWRLESNLGSHTLDSPLQTAPDFSLHEVSSGLGVKYVGVANLAYGLEYERLDGTYKGAPGALNYQQSSEQFAVNYAVSGLTKLNAAIGYTNRNLEGSVASVSGVTGALGYLRQLTGKTAINVQLTRAVNSYYNTGASELDTGGIAGVTWQALPKLLVELNYQRVHSVFEGQTLQAADTVGRVDNGHNEGLVLKYQWLRSVIIRPYVHRETRDSNIALFNYHNTSYGVEIRWQRANPN